MEKNDLLVPCLPESAPFTPTQRAYLNGFLAGLFSRTAPPAVPAAAAPASPGLMALTVLYGSQTGTAEGLARRLGKEASKRGFAPTLHDLAKYPTSQLATETRLVIITSTYGDGEPPDNAQSFWDFLRKSEAPDLSHVHFSVCALGDSNYPKFCAFGKDLEKRLSQLGAKLVYPRCDCDVVYEETFAAWLNAALKALPSPSNSGGSATSVPIHPPPRGAPAPADTGGFSREYPFRARLIKNSRLNASGSGKDTRHMEFSLEGAALAYEPGDALGVYPCNCPALVQALLDALHVSGDELVPGRDGNELPLEEALLRHYEITRISQPLLRAIAERTANEQLSKLAGPNANGELTAFTYGREIIDLLTAHPEVRFSPSQFVALLKKLAPRLYSISSSPKAHPGEVHLTVNVLRYESFGRLRKGVCSTFLADRTVPNTEVPIFVQTSKHFRLPASQETPVIMVGPGTGIAPFRAFLEERQATGAKGRNWLFFGEQHAASDFLYRDELLHWKTEGILTRLDTAFSRDQEHKVYVQQRMREHGRELVNWLEAGAHFYVCGDARRMAQDVDAELHSIIQAEMNQTPEQAVEYVNRLKAQQRYQRDVY